MITHLLVKFGLFFVGGAAFTLVVVWIIPNTKTLPVLGEQAGELEQTVHTEAAKKSKEKTDSFTSSIGNVLSSITESPILSPILKTKRDVETTVETVKSLPDEQRNAICSQICTP